MYNENMPDKQPRRSARQILRIGLEAMTAGFTQANLPEWELREQSRLMAAHPTNPLSQIQFQPVPDFPPET